MNVIVSLAAIDWSPLANGLITLLGLALAALALQARAWLVAKVHNDRARAVLERVWDLAAIEVRALAQAVVPVVVAAAADGKLSSEEAARIKDVAMQRVRARLGAAGVADLARAIGGADVGGFLSSVIEAQVFAAKAEAPARLAPAALASPVQPPALDPAAGPILAASESAR